MHSIVQHRNCGNGFRDFGLGRVDCVGKVCGWWLSKVAAGHELPGLEDRIEPALLCASVVPPRTCCEVL
jgi:hypothetical protein